MDFEKSIQLTYGVRFPKIPDDGIMRSFKHGGGEGFAILLDNQCGSFGHWGRNEAFAWNNGKVSPITIEGEKRPYNKRELQDAADAVAMGNKAADIGKPLEGQAMDLYIYSLCVLIEAKNDRRD